MNLRSKVEQLEQRTCGSAPQVDERMRRELAERIMTVYGDGAPLSPDAPSPTMKEYEALLAGVYRS